MRTLGKDLGCLTMASPSRSSLVVGGHCDLVQFFRIANVYSLDCITCCVLSINTVTLLTARHQEHRESLTPRLRVDVCVQR